MVRQIELGAILMAVVLVDGRPAAAQGVAVTVQPTSIALKANATQQFTAKVSGTANTSVTWLVGGTRGGAPSIGTISATGLYTAPADLTRQTTFVVEATSDAAPRTLGTASATIGAASGAGPNFYVATTGRDSNPGTAAAPWRTIQHAVDTVPAGATIFVQSGTYNELVTLSRSGSATAGFITLTAASGQSPVIDGTGLGIPGGQNGLVTLQNVSWVKVESFEIRNYASSGLAVPIGILVEGSGSHIELRNNHIHNIVVKETSSQDDALGILISGSQAPAALSQLIIDDNELDHLKTGFSESLSLSGNVTQWEVIGNRIHDNDNIGINIEGFFGTAPQTTYDQVRNGVVAGNTVFNITSKTNPAYQDTLGADGIYVDGGTLVTIQRNLVHDADIGLELASEVPGRATTNVLAHDNIVYHSPVTGLSIGGADKTRNGGTTSCVIANNTFFRNDTTQSGSGEFQVQFNASGNLVFNNILYANNQGLLVNDPAPQGVPPATMDHNLYASDAGNAGSQWIWLGKTYTGIAAYRAGSKEDAHGTFGNPQFLNTTTPDLHIAGTSSAVNLGLDLGIVDDGVADFGNAPRTHGISIDAGAYEH